MQIKNKYDITIVIYLYIKVYQIMTDLYTVRDVQQILKVDRLTVYRMLKDGRLQGIKIGHQWRFKKDSVDSILNGSISITEVHDAQGDRTMPVHCLQTIHNLVSEITGLDTIMLDPQGNLLTEANIQSDFCKSILKTSQGSVACKENWSTFARQSISGEKHHICHTGLHYSSIIISDQNIPVAVLLCGGYVDQQPALEELLEKHKTLAGRWNLSLAELQQNFLKLPVIDAGQSNKMNRWITSARHAVESVLSERSRFVGRMTEIANLTKI